MNPVSVSVCVHALDESIGTREEGRERESRDREREGEGRENRAQLGPGPGLINLS